MAENELMPGTPELNLGANLGLGLTHFQPPEFMAPRVKVSPVEPDLAPGPLMQEPGFVASPSMIAAAGAKYGLPGAFVNSVADIESGHGANMGDPAKTQYGGNIFQVGRDERKELGVSGLGSFAEQADYGTRLLAQRKGELEAKLGRPVDWGELYLAHQQGVSGAAKMLADPSGSAVATGTNILGNIPSSLRDQAKSWTNQQFVDWWKARVARGMQRFGGDWQPTMGASASLPGASSVNLNLPQIQVPPAPPQQMTFNFGGTQSPPSGSPLGIGSLMALALLSGQKQHSFTPVEYDPFAVQKASMPPKYRTVMGG